jgi:transcriptional regulator with XRE-family HTH domain
MDTPTDVFRAWTAARIQERRLSHAQLALRCGVDRSTITRLLRGERRPTLDIAVAIITVLDDACLPTPLVEIMRVIGSPARNPEARDDRHQSANHG